MKKVMFQGACDAPVPLADPFASQGDEEPLAISFSTSHPRSDRAPTRRIPRWVIVFAIIILLLVLTVVLIEITTNGMGNMQMAIPGHLPASVYGGQVQ